MKTILEILDSGTQWLQKKGIDDARRNMQLLMCHQLHCSKIQLYTSYDEQIKEEDLVPLRAMLAERGEGKPLQHLMGSVEFYKREFKTDGRALIPRPETEELVEICLNLLSQSEKSTLEILDLGCGSGVIGLSLAAELGGRAQVTCSDVSEAALELARENATQLTLNNVTFWQSDLFSSIEGSFDLIVANLPYVPETDRQSLAAELAHDPDLALFGGEDGLDIIRHFIPESKNHINNQGKLALEIGIHQAPAVESLLISAGFEEVSTLSDLSGIARFPIATANFSDPNQN